MSLSPLDDEERKALSMLLPWLKSLDHFPIPLEAIQEMFSCTKSNLKRSLGRTYQAGVDYKIVHRLPSGPCGGRPSEKIVLSVLCVKELLMTQNTAVGKRMRRYFLLAEEVLRRDLLQDTMTLYDVRHRYYQYDDYIKTIAFAEVGGKDEHYYQRRLEIHYAGLMLPRQSPYGMMDIHLADRIIEIKVWDDYKHALGQVLAYGTDKSQALEVAFFGPMPDVCTVQRIVSLFRRYAVKVSYFDEADMLVDVGLILDA